MIIIRTGAIVPIQAIECFGHVYYLMNAIYDIGFQVGPNRFGSHD
jgi:hypothetical protein